MLHWLAVGILVLFVVGCVGIGAAMLWHTGWVGGVFFGSVVAIVWAITYLDNEGY